MFYADALRNTINPAWSLLSIDDKIDALQAIEKHTADFEGRAERIIKVEEMKEGYYGYYNHLDSSYIHVSPFALETPEEAVKTVLHEGRHAYQHDCLDNKTGFPQPILDQFQEGFDNYIDPEDNFLAYANNFTETDAEDYAAQQMRLLEIDRSSVLGKANERFEDLGSHPSYSNSEETDSERYTKTEDSTAYHSESIAAESYDWANQSTFPELGREAEKVRGRSEAETLVTNLHDIPMSTQDFQQYNRYFYSDEVSSRPIDYQKGMGICLGSMAVSLSEGNETKYYESRDRFLDIDSYYRTFEQGKGTNVESSGSFNARRVPAKEEQKDLHIETANSDSIRSQAVKAAWEKEADRVRSGKGTWDWTVEQQAEMLSRSHTSNPGVSGFEGSHMLSAKDYPEHAGNPDNIQLIPTIAHYDGVHGRNPRANTPNGIYNPQTGEVIPIEDGQIPELPVFELTDRYDPTQHEFHDQHPDFDQSGEGRRRGFRDTKERHPEKSLNSQVGPESNPHTDEEKGQEVKEPELDMKPAPSTEKGREIEEPELDMKPAPSIDGKGYEAGGSRMNTSPEQEDSAEETQGLSL